jgi:inosose dehydratase
VHLKDVDVSRLQSFLAQGFNYAEIAKRDTFVELGRGSVDLAAVAVGLREAGYRGWLVVEQDRVVTENSDTLRSAAHNRAYVRRVFGC